VHYVVFAIPINHIFIIFHQHVSVTHVTFVRVTYDECNQCRTKYRANPLNATLNFLFQTWKAYNIEINPLTLELNPSAQRCLTRFFTGDFVSWTVHFVNIYVKNQQIHLLFIQIINYEWYLLHDSALHCHLQGVFLVPSARFSIEELSIEYCGLVCWCVVCSACTTSLHTTRSSTIFYRLLLNWASLRRH
jgi:hypothetical protein